jgi:5'-deoxynucleotidase YfbR-like HD superfamily hydrolase
MHDKAWFRERRAWLLAQDDAEVLRTAHQLRIPYKLKKTPRYATPCDPSVHEESVGDHLFALNYLMHYFLPLEDVDGRLDPLLVNRILLFHDFGEIVTGDKPYHLKSLQDEALEREAIAQLFEALPIELVRPGYDSWHDYETQMSLEGEFALALDKIEPMFELLDPINERSMKRLKFTFKDHIEQKLAVTTKFPVMRRFVDAISADMLRRGVFWEQGS